MPNALPTAVAKIFSYKKETAPSWGAPAASGAGAQLVRRVEGTFTSEIETFESDEVAPTFQPTDVQQGGKKATGRLRGRFSGKTYQDFLAGFCRQLFQTAPTTGALTNVTAAVGPITFTRAAGSFITDGFRVWDCVQWTGWATTGTANNSRYFLITSLTALVMGGVFLDGTTGGAKASGDSVTCTLVGKKTWIPQSGHTKDLFTFEGYQPDMTVTQSEVFYNMYTGSLALAYDNKGYCGLDFGLMGRAQQNSTGSPYFTSPSAITTTKLHQILDGAIYVNGTKMADVTGTQLNVDSQAELGPASYGSRFPGDIAPGRFKVSGQVTACFSDPAMRDAFLAGTKGALVLISRAGAAAQSDTGVIVLPSSIFLSSDPSDGGTGFLTRTYNISADNNAASTGSDQTTFSVQDTQAT